MGLFTPVKRHANKFRYIPRYYDPEKERREQRRRELHGTSSEIDNAEYTPGQYIRTQRDARRLAKSESGNKRKRPPMIVLFMVAAVAIVLYMLYPRVIGIFTATKEASTKSKIERYQEMENEAWPHSNSPITVVPNDYKEE